MEVPSEQRSEILQADWPGAERRRSIVTLLDHPAAGDQGGRVDRADHVAAEVILDGSFSVTHLPRVLQDEPLPGMLARPLGILLVNCRTREQAQHWAERLVKA